jgi:hypothetical protein
MTSYDLLCTTNWDLIKGKTFTEDEKRNVVDFLLSDIGEAYASQRFSRSVNAPTDGRRMYPIYYIPPYNGGGKYRLITGQMPKTHILSANHYELEILRLLALWAPRDQKVIQLVDNTVKRLDTTCFGHFCDTGECMGASVAALRFLTSAKRQDDAWVEELVSRLGSVFTSIRGQAATNQRLPVFYFALLSLE